MAWSNDARSVEDLLAAGGGMQGLKDVLSTVVQDALATPAWRETAPVRRPRALR